MPLFNVIRFRRTRENPSVWEFRGRTRFGVRPMCGRNTLHLRYGTRERRQTQITIPYTRIHGSRAQTRNEMKLSCPSLTAPVCCFQTSPSFRSKCLHSRMLRSSQLHVVVVSVQRLGFPPEPPDRLWDRCGVPARQSQPRPRKLAAATSSNSLTLMSLSIAHISPCFANKQSLN